MAEVESITVPVNTKPAWSTNVTKANLLLLCAIELSPRFGVFISSKPETTIILMGVMNMVIHEIERFFVKLKITEHEEG